MAELKNTTVQGTGAINLPSGTTAQRPIKTDIYTSTGSTTWTVPTGVTAVETLVVGGGGGSGGGGSTGYHGGGGGGGGVVYHPSYTVTPGSIITISVGTGGSAGAQSGDSGFTGGNGGNSQFDSLIANGGGGGGGNSQNSRRGNDGGSGGGGALYGGVGGSSNQPSYSGATVYGNSGGNGQSTYGSGGAGGGAGGPGGTGASNIGGNGGIGIPFDITGTTIFYGGGGAAAGNSRHGEAVRGATPAYTATNNGTGAGGGGRQSVPGLQGSSGIVVVRYAVDKTPDDWIGFMRFNTDLGVKELWDGKNWVNADNGLTTGLGLAEYAPAPSAKYIKEAAPNSTNGFYWIRPPGVDRAYQVYCDMETMGGGWMLLWYNHGGPQQSGNNSMYGVLNGSESDNVRPFQYGGTKGWGKARHAEHWMNQAGGTIMKTYAGYNSSNTKLNGSQSSDSGFTDGAGGNNGRLYWSDTGRVVADRLELGDRVTYRDIVGTSIGTTSSYAITNLNNRVSLFLDNGTTQGSRLYGQTSVVISTTGNRGFSNYLDPNGTEPYMLHWAARHWISYSSNASGSNANRCQFVCYGSENLWIEHGWFYREQGIAQ